MHIPCTGQYTDGIGSGVVTELHEGLIIIIGSNVTCRFRQGITVDAVHLHYNIQ
jgi:hypothetical protein